MKERPILFYEHEVIATLDRRQSQFRRVIKPQPWVPNDCRKIDPDGTMDVMMNPWTPSKVKCPYGVPGDRLFWTMAAPSWAGQTPEERFWARVYKTDTCWEWLGQVVGHAKHGTIKIGQRSIRTHRYSWELHHGDPGGAQVLHTCDIGWCVNPDHLYLGTGNDNRRDQSERGRIRHLCQSDNPASKISNEQAEMIRSAYARGAMQQDLAAQHGIHQSQVSRIVNGLRRAGETTPGLPMLGSRWLEITDVRVERVQDTSYDDMTAEGVDTSGPVVAGILMLITETNNLDDAQRVMHRDCWIELWDSINAKRGFGWDVNPWVWAIEFKMTKEVSDA